jgi:hypothetical protein
MIHPLGQRRPLACERPPSSLLVWAVAAVAQLVEQRIRNAWVGGSNPFRGTSKFKVCEWIRGNRSAIDLRRGPNLDPGASSPGLYPRIPLEREPITAAEVSAFLVRFA